MAIPEQTNLNVNMVVVHTAVENTNTVVKLLIVQTGKVQDKLKNSGLILN